MSVRTATMGGVLGLALVAGAVGTRLALQAHSAVPASLAAAADPVPTDPADDGDADLPLPPVPPRIAEGEQYEQCLSMLATDPAGASTTAENWEAAGGGDGAAHCHALAQVALGEVEQGAEELEKLAGSSQAAAAGRAAVYGQAGQAWLVAGDASRAYAAATLALALDPDDADLLIDRAVAAASLNRYADAADDLSRALDFDPKRPDAMVLRGSAERHLNRLPQARADIDAALAADPDNAEGLLERGILRQRAGDRAGARADWTRVGTLAPDTATADLAQQNLALLEAGPDQRRP